jgi:hypothetical protein
MTIDKVRSIETEDNHSWFGDLHQLMVHQGFDLAYVLTRTGIHPMYQPIMTSNQF